jgi:hypothetical protein
MKLLEWDLQSSGLRLNVHRRVVHYVLNFPKLWMSSRNTTKPSPSLQSAEQFYTKTLVRKCRHFSMQCLHYILE